MFKQIKATVESISEQSCSEKNKQDLLLDLDSHEAVANSILNFVTALVLDEEKCGLSPMVPKSNFDVIAKFLLLFDTKGMIPESVELIVTTDLQRGHYKPNVKYKLSQPALWYGLNTLAGTPLFLTKVDAGYALEFDQSSAIFDIETLDSFELNHPDKICILVEEEVYED